MTRKKQPQVPCPDCGAMVASLATHNMFCEAKTCTGCGTTYSYVVRETGEEIEQDGETIKERLCDNCLFDDEDYESKDEDEPY